MNTHSQIAIQIARQRQDEMIAAAARARAANAARARHGKRSRRRIAFTLFGRALRPWAARS